MFSEDELFLCYLPEDWEKTLGEIEERLMTAGHDYSGFFRKLRDEIEEVRGTHYLIERQAYLLTGVVNAIRGEPQEALHSWSHHDAPDLAKAVVAERDQLRAQSERPA